MPKDPRKTAFLVAIVGFGALTALAVWNSIIPAPAPTRIEREIVEREPIDAGPDDPHVFRTGLIECGT